MSFLHIINFLNEIHERAKGVPSIVNAIYLYNTVFLKQKCWETHQNERKMSFNNKKLTLLTRISISFFKEKKINT